MVGRCDGVRHIPIIWSVPPEHLYCEGAPRAKDRSRLVLPSPDPSQVGRRTVWGTKGGMGTQAAMSVPCHCFLQAPEAPGTTGHSRVQWSAAWDSGSSLTLSSGSSLSSSLHVGPSPSARCCPEPISIVWIPLAHC